MNLSKKDYVYQIFQDIAENYDLMNNIITIGNNLRIKKRAIKNIPIKPKFKILDICTGTGDIAIYLAKNYDVEVIALDFSDKMLELSKAKAINLTNITFIQGDALQLPFDDDYFDVSIISYGLRNLENLEKGLIEMKRVTKTEGYITNLDVGKPVFRFFGLFDLYFFKIVPLLGKIIHGNKAPYQYLPNSSIEFPSQTKLIKLMQDIGLKNVKNYNYIFGSIAQQIGQK